MKQTIELSLMERDAIKTECSKYYQICVAIENCALEEPKPDYDKKEISDFGGFIFHSYAFSSRVFTHISYSHHAFWFTDLEAASLMRL